MHVLQALRERLRCKEIWVEGAHRYRNPEEDLPTDFAEERDAYYQALEKPLDPNAFIARLQHHMHQTLQTLDTGHARESWREDLAAAQGVDSYLPAGAAT